MSEQPFPDSLCESVARTLEDIADEIREEDVFGSYTEENNIHEKTSSGMLPKYQITSAEIDMDIETPQYEMTMWVKDNV